MSESMNESEARVTLLKLIQQRLTEHRRAAEDNPEWRPLLELSRDDFKQFATVLGWSAPETSALYKRLVLGGLVRQKDGDLRFLETGGVVGPVWIEDLRDPGLRVIGVLDPAEELVEALRAALEDLEDADDIPDDKKTTWREWIERGITTMKTAEGAARIAQRIAQEIAERFGPSG